MTELQRLVESILGGAKVNPLTRAAEVPGGDVASRPRSSAQLKTALTTLATGVEDSDAGDVYDAVATALGVPNNSISSDGDAKPMGDKKNEGLDKLAQMVRESINRQLKEVGLSFSGWPGGGADYGEDDGPKRPKNKNIIAHADDGMMDLPQIGKELGLTTSGAKKAVQQALAKVRFLNLDMDEDLLAEMTEDALDDYVEFLQSSGELTDEDVEILHAHPQLVAELDGFREFFAKYLKDEMKAQGAPLQLGRNPGDKASDDED